MGTCYLFTNQRANRFKVLVHDGLGIWLYARDCIWEDDAACEGRFGSLKTEMFMQHD